MEDLALTVTFQNVPCIAPSSLKAGISCLPNEILRGRSIGEW